MPKPHLPRSPPHPNRINVTRLGCTDIWSLSFNFRFSSRRFKVNKNQLYSLAVTFLFILHTVSLKKPHWLYEPQLVNMVRNILLQHNQKSYLLYKFSSIYISGCCQKKDLHCVISRRPRITSSKHLEMHLFYLLWPSIDNWYVNNVNM